MHAMIQLTLPLTLSSVRGPLGVSFADLSKLRDVDSRNWLGECFFLGFLILQVSIFKKT